MKRVIVIAFGLFLIGSVSEIPVPSSHALPSPHAAGVKTSTVEVAGTKQWVDTNIDLRGGAKIRVTATGQITYPADDSYAGKAHTLGTFGPDGLPRGFADLIHQYPVGSAGHGALIGRIGTADYAQPFLVGASKEYDAPVGGRLFLGINQSEKDTEVATGSFQVKIEVLAEGTGDAAAVGGPTESRIPGITNELLDKIPRRVSDPSNNPGDMVNVLIIGTQDQVVQAFTTGGWVQIG